MSAVQALAEIQNILRKYRMTSKVTTWHEADGNSVTKIIVKDSAGIQSKPPVFNYLFKKKKNPSKIRRDTRRREAYAVKMAESKSVSPKLVY